MVRNAQKRCFACGKTVLGSETWEKGPISSKEKTTGFLLIYFAGQMGGGVGTAPLPSHGSAIGYCHLTVNFNTCATVSHMIISFEIDLINFLSVIIRNLFLFCVP